MSGELAKTVERVLTEVGTRRLLSPGLLVNPNFVHIEWPDNNDFDFGPSGTYEPVWLRRCPGWWPYGPAGDNAVGSGSYVRVQNSILSDVKRPLNLRSVKNGVKITQQLDRKAGLCQLIPLSEAIRGRRVRLTATYKVAVGSEFGAVGISVWLKSKKTSVTTGVGSWNAGGRGYDYVDLKTNMLSTSTSMRHIVSILKGGNSYGSGTELYNPYFDELRHIQSGANSIGRLYFHSPNASEGVLTAPTGEAVTVFYLDNDLSGDPATDGTFELYTELPGDAGIHRVEQYIDVPSHDDLFEDGECWVIVMPVSPANFGSMTVDAEIDLLSLNIEVVNKEPSDEDEFLSGFLASSIHPTGFGTSEGGLSQRQMFRYPIAVPTIYPLNVMTVRGFTSVEETDTAIEMADAEAEPPITDNARVVLTSGVEKDWVFPQSPLPLGSAVLRAGIQVNNETAVDVSPSLYELAGYRPTTSITAGDKIRRKIAKFVDVLGGADVFREVAAYRNRIGFLWPDLENPFDPDSITMGPSEIVAALHVPAVVGADVVKVATGYILAAVDPRMAQCHYRRTP